MGTEKIEAQVEIEGLGMAKAARYAQAINVVDLVLSHAGVVPPGAVPLVINVVVGVLSFAASAWAHRKIKFSLSDWF